MKICIGIISYLPDDKDIRLYRKEVFKRLLDKCNEIFKLPYIIVAQNYNEEDYNDINITDGVVSKSKEALGIVGARNKLRELFINSEYDYIIMLDDDCTLLGTDASEYIRQIENNPNGYCSYYKSVLKLFAISKEIFKQVSFANINPELGEGFEDRIFYNTLLKKYPEKEHIFKDINIAQRSEMTADTASTWYKDQDIKKMLENTKDIISKL